jgi:hypothetical protein
MDLCSEDRGILPGSKTILRSGGLNSKRFPMWKKHRVRFSGMYKRDRTAWLERYVSHSIAQLRQDVTMLTFAQSHGCPQIRGSCSSIIINGLRGSGEVSTMIDSVQARLVLTSPPRQVVM